MSVAKQLPKRGLSVKERRKAANSLAHHRERLIARSIPLEDLPDEDPAEMMDLMIRRVSLLVRHAAAEVDRLKPGLARNQSRDELEHEQWSHWDEQGNLVVMSNYWVEREAELRAEMLRLTEKAQALGLAERNVRIKETQYRIMGEGLKAACEAIGLTPAVQQALGAALRDELNQLEQAAA